MTVNSPRAKRMEALDRKIAKTHSDVPKKDAVSRNRNIDPVIYQKSLVKHRIAMLKEDLPHLHGRKWYAWARKFFESTNRINLLCAANQISKSSTAIRKNIEFAGNPDKWKIWKTKPQQFWYFYPTSEIATIEFEKKWVPEFLPRGEMKNHQTYGWDVTYDKGEIQALHFRSGVSIYFKAYSQHIKNLQTATLHMVTGDEEMPPDYVDELLARMRATGGIFNQVFTATVGYQLWYRAMECIGTADEAFPTAFKQVVSMMECEFYEDGSPSPWTPEAIQEAINQCTSPAEVQKRIHGRFVKDEGRKYGTFDPTKNVGMSIPVPKDWRIYGGVDIGSGGKGRSAGAIVFIAVNPTFTTARVVKTWRGDYEETTAKDILEHYRELKGKDAVTLACYDYQSREFGLIADRSGEPFIKADKARTSGEQIVNTLFKSCALSVDGGVYDNQKLVTELMSVPAGDKNRKFQDDLTDALRYVTAMVPWDFPKISPDSELAAVGNDEGVGERDEVPDVRWTRQQHDEWEIRQRRGVFPSDKNGQESDDWKDFQQDIDDWNTAYGN